MSKLPTLLQQCDAAAMTGWPWVITLPTGENRKRCTINVAGRWLVVPADVWNVDGWAWAQAVTS